MSRLVIFDLGQVSFRRCGGHASFKTYNMDGQAPQELAQPRRWATVFIEQRAPYPLQGGLLFASVKP